MEDIVFIRFSASGKAGTRMTDTITENGMMQANRQMNGTREFITVYSGELTLIFKDHEYVLKAGDAASYNAFDDYVYKNTGKGMVTANIVVHYSN